jgi:hypothetical protein
MINGKEVDEATWYINGGIDAEKKIADLEKYIDEQRQW